MIETHDLVPYQSLGTNRGISLRYDSERADPRPILHFGYSNVSGNFGLDAPTKGNIIHINTINSAFGSGWGLAGLQEIVVNADQSVIIIDGNGSELLFENKADNSYKSPVGDFSTLERLNDGTFRRTMTDKTVYSFNGENLLTKMRDRVGNETQYVYENRRLMKMVDPVGLETTFTYSNNRIIEIKDPAGRSTKLTYDTNGNLIKITDPDGTSRTWEYDPNHLMISEVDKRGNKEQTFYDFAGRADRAIRIVQLNPTSRRFTYDPTFNQLTSMTDELGHQTLYQIDPNNGNLLSLTQVVGEVGGNDDIITQFTYTNNGLVDLITDPLGRITDSDYDANGRLISIIYAKGTADEAKRQFEYDLAGNQTAIIDENSNRTTFEYDALNRLVKIIEADPDGNGPLTSPITTYSYDADGNLISTIDAVGNVNQNTYDKLNRLIENIDTLNQKTSYSYDSLGNLLSVVDPLGHKTENKYDARNRVIETIAPDLGSTKFTYDLSNNLTSVTDPVNNKTIFAYDARDRSMRQTSPTGLVTAWEYDATNNLTATDKFQISSINTVNYSDFSNMSGLTLNGDTADVNQTPIVDNNQSVLRLINGSAFLSEPISLIRDNLNTSFSSAFQFRIPNAAGLEDSDGTGADGFTFVLATSPTVLGVSGGGLGYGGIENSLAVEFDTYNNGGLDQMGIDLNGDITSFLRE